MISICRRHLFPDGSTTCRTRSLEPSVHGNADCFSDSDAARNVHSVSSVTSNPKKTKTNKTSNKTKSKGMWILIYDSMRSNRVTLLLFNQLLNIKY